MSNLLIHSFLMSDVSKSLRSLTKNEGMSKSLEFLSELLIHSFFACFFEEKNEQFAQKTDEGIPNPVNTCI